MAEKRRVEIPGGMFHVTGRGNARAPIFLDDIDYVGYLRVLATVVARFAWVCHSYCLLPNHVHVFVETPEPNLGKGMRILNGTYAQRFNARYERVGHVFQGPYKAETLNRDGHLLEVCRYISLNPVKAGLCEDAALWPWSSYSALAGLSEAPSFLEVDFVRSLFGGAAGYRAFVADGERQRPGRD
jgi:putative transposase